ncbi:SH3 and multiple ankyrin repeat domains protein 3 isoform X4 [Leptopilina heterotoma]|uniref:SH3 and multiple ankyrin repeat domains protein 3 isoform X4 n=1 Tax=Leptopilina heterotoma TaxID=63436 RepID=UPI001CA9D7AB|nr:SH3 and multiple ankyrin repeat domains protein 3 isoform X4 [Leptopilina heterotoma]
MEVNFKSIVTSGVEQIEISNSSVDQDETRNSDLDHERFLITRIHVPELCISKCLQFSRDQFVWDVKQQCLASLPKELKESFNYGLFCPPTNGKAGKFLDEERRLGDYPFNGPVGYLELKYKKRIYKMLNLDEKQLKAMHNKTNLKKFLEHVINSQIDKISRMCNKGLDPNFHCPETGETPLTFASTLKKSASVIIALVNGGAILDYRTKEGLTAMHRAVERNNLEAVKTLLELGASPNYKDSKALTPLYYSVTYKTDPMLCEALLHDHASLGAQDLQGWQEVHQACRNNLVQHLDHLLFYGADMNARNASGNTPLHVCAVNNTDSSCIRQLLFRGAQKDSLNFANQTPYQVAVIAGNLELAEVIKNYGQEEVDKSIGDTASDVISDSSGFGTSQSDTNSSTIPGSTVVCVESYCSAIPGHLSISEGDLLEVTGATDCGLLEGILRDQGMGLFPAHCVEEVKLRNSSITTGLPLVRDNCTRVIGRRETPQIYFATAPRLKKSVPAQARTVILHRSKKGFGFVLRGAKSHALIGFAPSAEFPASQYLEDVDLGGISDLAGLKKGDFIIKINGEDVTVASHDHVVELIQQSRELVRMTVISPIMNHSSSHSTRTKLTGQSFQRQYATLPRKGNNNINAGGTLGRSPAPLPPRRDPKTTLSIGRARARSMVAGLEGGIEIENRNNVVPSDLKSTSIDSIYLQQQTFLGSNAFQTTLMQPRSMSLRIRPSSTRVTNAELKFQLNSELCILNGLRESLDLHRDFHSTPDLNIQAQSTCLAPKCHRSQEDVSMMTFFNKYPPPSHPPPPPPVDQLSNLNTTSNASDINNSASVYDNMAHIQQVKELAAATESGRLSVMSSFRPLSSAKLYASPKDLKSVGYRSQYISTQSMKQHIRKPNSVRVSKESTSFKFIKNINKKNSNGISDMNFNGKISKLETNQYAQPLKSVKNDNKNGGFKERMDKNVTTSFSAMNLLSNMDSSSYNANAVPPLPEPDYSLSESENEAENNLEKIDIVNKKKEVNKTTPTEKIEPDKETSEHSNASGDSESNNSYNSGSLPHSFSIEEIQHVKKQLKTKHSFAEDGDNSSSGVSSDQDIPVGPPSGFDDTTRKGETRHHANEKSSDKENCSIKRFNHGSSGILTRHAVSLTQLPPPIEAEAEDQSSDLFVPPPPGFNAEESCTVISSDLVFAPPPQFCDNRQQLHNCVKIIRTVSKP